MLRGQVTDIIAGTILVSFGAVACVIAAIRWRSGARLLVWWGICSALYGTNALLQTPAFVAALPSVLQSANPCACTAVVYLIVVAALFAWREFCIGRLRTLVEVEIAAAIVIAIGGVVEFLRSGSMGHWMFANNALVVFSLLPVPALALIPALTNKYMIIPQKRVLRVGTLIFAIESLSTGVLRLLHYDTPAVADALGFGALLLALGYVALQMMFSNESRLLAIQVELDTARRIQTSILPATVPELEGLRIAATYQPMTDVAGDFYQFVQPDAKHVGVLIADVSGHGIPAALVSSMIKVAMQAAVGCPGDPAQVLGVLNRILSSETHGQFATAAYLWIDMETHTALYSAAGNPPLLCWRGERGEIERIESNGLLFGVQRDGEYPVCRVALRSSDRLLLYTDGVTEPENAAGEAFGDRQLERVLRENRAQPAEELSRRLLAELGKWRPASASQQDDITLIVVDYRPRMQA